MKRDARITLVTLLAAAVAASGAACVPFGTKPLVSSVGPLKECGADALIDDFEDNNTQIAVIGDRGGYWYTYADKQGSTVWPVEGDKGGTFTMVDGGHDSKFAANVKGHLVSKSDTYAAMGLNFLDPKGGYDASAYEGITFFTKRGSGSNGKLWVKVSDGNTDPDGGICSACFNDYQVQIEVGDVWQRVVIPFHDLRQEGDWGSPRKPHVDRGKLYAIHFESKTPGADFDFLVDDIAFICKG
jgi:hypothetical protein